MEDQGTERPICELQLFTLGEYIGHISAKYQVTSPIQYHHTHTSSPKNNFLGSLANCSRWRIYSFLHIFPTDYCFHPRRALSLDYPKLVYSEADGLRYAHNLLLNPLLEILTTYFPTIQFDILCEPEYTAILGTDLIENVEAKSKVDVEIRARVGPGEGKTILLYEAKSPRTLLREEWDSSLGGEGMVS